MNRKGFTLIELILVISILGILAVAALPKFISVGTSAKDAARDGVAGAVRSGIALYRANEMVANNTTANYPSVLDSNASSACITCFTNILVNPVNDTAWVKSAANTYTYNNGTAITTYTYNALNGTF